MTCIVGFVEGNTVWMGGDSAGTNAWLDQCLYESPKVFKNGEMLIGTSGSARQGDLLRWALTVPDHDPRTDVHKYMVTTFIDAVRTCFNAGGVAAKNNNVESMEGAFLVGYRGKLFVVYSDYQVRIPKQQFAAVGCGDQIAHGALFASNTFGRDRAEIALRAAESFSAGVRGPFSIDKLEHEHASVTA
jgi:ATP-dependent protease HslVU (ClpYQ) peptidase subunit